MGDRPAIGRREAYPHFLAIATRWMDNDFYGHINNVNYYSYVDTVINRYLIDQGRFDYREDPVVAIVVETRCKFYQSFSYPEVIEGGLRVEHIGRSSVRYQVGLFAAGEETARAESDFVHVFVERDSNKPVPIPDKLRTAFERILVAP